MIVELEKTKSTPTVRKLVSKTGIKHIEFWTAVLILVCTMASGVAATIRYFKPVRDALESRPLEGVWDMTLDYEKFHGETGSWSGKGKALIIWQRGKQRYDIYFGTAIKKSGDPKPVLAGFSNGYIAAGQDGLPPESFAIENIEWIARVHANGEEPSKAYYEYTNCKYTTLDTRADKIEGKFKTAISEGVMRLKWAAPLN